MNNLTKRNLTKQLVGMATLLVMLFTAMPTLAQNVTVHPGNGSMLPAVKSGGMTDTFYDLCQRVIQIMTPSLSKVVLLLGATIS